MKRFIRIRSLIAIALLTSAGFALATNSERSTSTPDNAPMNLYWVEPFNDTHYKKVDVAPENCGLGTQIVCRILTNETPEDGLIPVEGSTPQSFRNP